MLATDYARYYKLDPQGKDESDLTFRRRVSQALREMGYIIEAHEAYQDKRYEESNDVITGIFGAMAQALDGVNYSGDPIGNDIAAGTVARYQMSPEGQAEKEGKEMIARLLLSGISPDDIKKLMG